MTYLQHILSWLNDNNFGAKWFTTLWKALTELVCIPEESFLTSLLRYVLVIIFSTFSQTFVPVDVIVCQGLCICNRNVQMHLSPPGFSHFFFLSWPVSRPCFHLEKSCPCGGVYSECGWQLSPIWPPGRFHCLRLMIRTSTNDLLGFSYDIDLSG